MARHLAWSTAWRFILNAAATASGDSLLMAMRSNIRFVRSAIDSSAKKRFFAISKTESFHVSFSSSDGSGGAILAYSSNNFSSRIRFLIALAALLRRMPVK